MKTKDFISLMLVPVLLGVVGFLGNFFVFEYQTTKANVLLNENRIINYNSQIEEMRAEFKEDLNELKESQKHIINILLKEKRDERRQVRN